MSDLEARCFIKKGNSLVPADFAADEFLAEIKDGREVVVTIRRPRSPSHHRWFFALLRKVVDNSDQWADEEDLLDDLKFSTGHRARRVNMLTGEVYEVAKSISFASMPEAPFQRFKHRCLYVLSKFIGVDPVTLMEEVDATQRPAGVSSPSLAPQQRETVDG